MKILTEQIKKEDLKNSKYLYGGERGHTGENSAGGGEMGEIVYEHKEAAAGKWAKMPLNLQMGNYGGNSFGTDPVKMQKYYDDFILLGR